MTAARVSETYTNEELTELARQLYRGEIFTSTQVRKEDLSSISMIFLPLAFAADVLRETIANQKPEVVYAKMNDALPRGINGYPMFTSCAFFNKAEWDFVYDKFLAIKKAMESI